eukprot:1157223-Pelagomonas_calceolata.AAC.2
MEPVKVVPALLYVTAAPPRLTDEREKELIIGESCLDGSLSQKIGSSLQTRKLKAQESNASIVVTTARISDSGALAITGACVNVWSS